MERQREKKPREAVRGEVSGGVPRSPPERRLASLLHRNSLIPPCNLSLLSLCFVVQGPG